MAIVYINIGSNLGHRQHLIERAIERIGDYFGYYCISRFVESEPWGFNSTNPFLNIGVAFKSDLSPEEVLDKLQNIEKELSDVNHRDEDGNYKDREIDIDIMAIDRLKINSERLTLPHRYLFQRNFFLEPLNELYVNGSYPKI